MKKHEEVLVDSLMDYGKEHGGNELIEVLSKTVIAIMDSVAPGTGWVNASDELGGLMYVDPDHLKGFNEALTVFKEELSK